MTLQQLRYAVKAAQLGSFTAAAEAMMISQPSLTNAIHALEQEMGVTIFTRSSKGVFVTREGEEFLSYAREMLEQEALMLERFTGTEKQAPRFSVSCQHYSFCVNAFVDVIKLYPHDSYDFTIRETRTHEIIEDVALGRSEIGVLYLSSRNKDVLERLFRKNDLVFMHLYTASPHVFISRFHPLVSSDRITLEDLQPYPYLSFEQGDYNAFYFSEEILSTLDRQKNIKVRDRATLFNLAIGLNGYTVSSGVIDPGLNGEDIIARKLDVNESMDIGCITRKSIRLTPYAKSYIHALQRHLSRQ